MPTVITLTGPSLSGKSTTINRFLKKNSVNFKPKSFPKYTTRKKRKNDSSIEVKPGYISLPKKCDIVYEQYGARYGIAIKDLINDIKEGYVPILVLNDIRTIKEIKSILGDIVISIFLYRTEPKTDLFDESLRKERGEINFDEIKKRNDKAKAIYRIYIENIYVFDKVIINYGDGFDFLSQQVDSITEYIIDKEKKSKFI